jgi:ABC-type branched-subunit amino acid transport system ATPase component
MSQQAIHTNNLNKRFGEFVAVNNVNIEVKQGEIFSLFGPIGAGKSTTISMLSCLLEPSGGEAYEMGHSVMNEAQVVKLAMCVVPQDVALYPDLPALVPICGTTDSLVGYTAGHLPRNKAANDCHPVDDYLPGNSLPDGRAGLPLAGLRAGSRVCLERLALRK